LNTLEVPLEDGKVPLKNNRLQFKEGYIELEKKQFDRLSCDFYSNNLTTLSTRIEQVPKTKYTVYLQVRLSHLLGLNRFGRRETTTIYSNIVPLNIDLTCTAHTLPTMASPSSQAICVKRKAESKPENQARIKKNKV